MPLSHLFGQMVVRLINDSYKRLFDLLGSSVLHPLLKLNCVHQNKRSKQDMFTSSQR